MTKEKFKIILEEVNNQFKDFYFIGSYEEALENEDFKNIMKIWDERIKPFLKENEDEFSNMIYQYSDQKVAEILPRDKNANYISWHWWGFRWHIGWEGFKNMRIAGGGSALPPGTIPVWLIIQTITLYAPALMAAIAAVGILGITWVSQAAVCMSAKQFWNTNKNVVVGFSYFVTPIVNCYLES